MLVDGAEVHLTPIEFELLRTLMQGRGRLLTHRALLTEVWGPGYEYDTQTLRVHVANLRRKIEPQPRRAALHRHGPGRRLPLRRLARSYTRLTPSRFPEANPNRGAST